MTDTPKPPRQPSPFRRVARSDKLFARLHIDAPKLIGIGQVGVLAAMMENWAERAIWSVEGHEPRGLAHWTDGKMVSQLIERLETRVDAIADDRLKELVAAWCKAAVPANKCRNSILHGIPVSLGPEWVNFERNFAWDGAERQRAPSTFSADDHTLALLVDVYAVLVRSLIAVAKWRVAPQPEEATTILLSALRETRTIAAELENLAAAVNHEKY